MEPKVTNKGSMGGVQGVFQLINKTYFNIKPLCWRVEGLSKTFHNQHGQILLFFTMQMVNAK